MRARVEVALLQPTRVASASERTEILTALDAELRAVTHQVDELLQLARADAAGDGVMTDLQPLYLDDLIADEMPRWQPQVQQLGASLSLGALEETRVRGDAVLLARLSGVLVDNALRYGGSPGVVRVSVRPDGPDALLIVEDNGTGVAMDERDRIFDRFYRGEAARHRRA
jgi:two-component system OmpR family sensor kinase